MWAAFRPEEAIKVANLTASLFAEFWLNARWAQGHETKGDTSSLGDNIKKSIALRVQLDAARNARLMKRFDLRRVGNHFPPGRRNIKTALCEIFASSFFLGR